MIKLHDGYIMVLYIDSWLLYLSKIKTKSSILFSCKHSYHGKRMKSKIKVIKDFFGTWFNQIKSPYLWYGRQYMYMCTSILLLILFFSLINNILLSAEDHFKLKDFLNKFYRYFPGHFITIRFPHQTNWRLVYSVCHSSCKIHCCLQCWVRKNCPLGPAL